MYPFQRRALPYGRPLVAGRLCSRDPWLMPTPTYLWTLRCVIGTLRRTCAPPNPIWTSVTAQGDWVSEKLWLIPCHTPLNFKTSAFSEVPSVQSLLSSSIRAQQLSPRNNCSLETGRTLNHQVQWQDYRLLVSIGEVEQQRYRQSLTLTHLWTLRSNSKPLGRNV